MRKDAAYVLRLNSGEELINALEKFTLKKGIRGAWFWAIGAADDIEIAFYDLKRKKYATKRFIGRLEIVSMTGNVALKSGVPVIHAHGVFSKANFSTVGGHIVSCRISATCEIYLEKSSMFKRKLDKKTGLNPLTP